MSLLVRKIERAKWLKSGIPDRQHVPADAITSGLRTHDNDLSTWTIESESQLEDAVLAIVSSFERLETIDVVTLDREDIDKAGLRIEASEGVTVVKELVGTHRDIKDLTYSSLGTVADIVVECFKTERVVRFRAPQLKQILADAIGAGRLEKVDLKESVRSKIE